MAKTARERLARLLDDAEPAGSFSAQLPLPAHFLQLEVMGAGLVSLPVRAAQAKKLIAVARPAKFGRGAETVTDTGVRDTWEIAPAQVRFGGPGWTALMDSALEQRQGRPYTLVLTKTGELFTREKDARHRAVTDLAWLTSAWGDGSPGIFQLSTWRHGGVVRPWERRLSGEELSELLLRHPELVAEAEEITSTLLVVENDQPLRRDCGDAAGATLTLIN